MCGIAGIFNLEAKAVSPEAVASMSQVMRHRGPDGQGAWHGAPHSPFVALGHRRLAILDLSSAGAQPMWNDDRSLGLTYNGEIYNYPELRKELEQAGCRFRSQCDAEVILHAYRQWGAQCVSRFNGMFAFAMWDEKKQALFLARDRYGIKPLYYTVSKSGDLVFASEIKALLKHPEVKAELDLAALQEYFTFQNVFSNRTFFQNITLLAPGSVMTAHTGSARLFPESYWDYDFRNAFSARQMSEQECARELSEHFQRAVERQLLSDVSVGAYLSGGMDSGSITAVAARAYPALRTFTAGFDVSSAHGSETEFDERRAARFMAERCGTEHYEMEIKPSDMAQLMPALMYHIEEPRLGMCYQNYLIAKLASKHVKVALAGTGGDELFAGYPWRYAGALNAADTAEFAEQSFDYWQRLVRVENHGKFFAPEIMRAEYGAPAHELFLHLAERACARVDMRRPLWALQASLYVELRTFLRGLFLLDDKIGMAHSLEVRVPFLDNDLVDYSLKIPAEYKLQRESPGAAYRTSAGKMILRRSMASFVPAEVAGRAKQGFSTPDATWFREDSRDYLSDILLSKRASQRGIIQPGVAEAVLEEHLSGRHNHRLLLWSLLSFEWWCRVFLDGERPA